MKTVFLLLLSGVCSFGQNFAVLLAKDDATSQAGFPTNWPVRVQPIGNATKLPENFPPPWRFATQAQVERWKTDHASEMESYQAAKEAAATQPKRDREAVIRQAIDDLRTIRDSNGTLTALQLSNAVRAIAKALVAVIEEIRP
ncbi:MAG: hypothetical protein E6R03_05645 [Hyphomicrobiaceae bacterium]|nr:MAG: hypothetical protein E6R03_05645 [Hyphomicrobiaceae bacterium]